MNKTIVSLDTSFLIGENYLNGSKIRELGELSKEGTIKLVLTRVVYEELLNNFYREVLSLREKIDKAIWAKNIIEIHKQLQFDPKQTLNNFKSNLDNFLTNNKIIFLEYDDLYVSDLLKDYFAGNPPFGSRVQKNKNEFPDAIILKSYEKYLKNNSEHGVLITYDVEVLKYKSSVITVCKDASKLLDKINRSIADKQYQEIIEKAFSIYDNSKESLCNQFSHEIQNELYNHTRFIGNRYQIEEIILLKNIEISMTEPRVIEVEANDFKLDVKAKLKFTLDVGYLDLIYRKQRIKKIYFNETFDIEITISIDRNIAWFTKNMFEQYLYPLINYLD